MNLCWFPMPIFFHGASKCSHSVCAFFSFFFSTGDGSQYQEDNGTGGALRTKADMLSAESNRLGPDAGLSANSIKRAFNLMSQSFLVRGLKSLQILHFSCT